MKTKARVQEFDVQVTTKISAKRIADLLVGAYEGGSNHWIAEIALGPEVSGFGSDDYYPRIVRYPLSGGYVNIRTIEDDPKLSYRLDEKAIKRGLNLMATKYPKHFSDFVQKNDDAITADIFLQLAVLGEIVYG